MMMNHESGLFPDTNLRQSQRSNSFQTFQVCHRKGLSIGILGFFDVFLIEIIGI